MSMRRVRFGLFVCLTSALILLAGCRHHRPTSHPTSSETTDTLKQTVSVDRLSGLRWPNFKDYSSLVQTFYSNRDWEMAWVEQHKPTPQALQLIKLFEGSAAKGLNAADYDAPRWSGRLTKLGKDSDVELAQFDLAMTVTAMRYISDLHIGRVNPSHFSFGVNVQQKKYDLPAFLEEQVIGIDDAAKALAGIEPETGEYRSTMQALARYRAMAAQETSSGWQPLPVPATPVTMGGHYAEAGRLRQRLQLLGDLGGDTTGAADPPQPNYDTELAGAVKHFQLRHGLTNDGKLTPRTVAALNVPLDVRVHQLEDSLERWRWLSDQFLNAPLVVNIPEYALRAYGDDHKVEFMMKVVVGDSLKEERQTPVLAETLKYVVMRPYWNVTPTIIKQEIVPHVEQDKNYLDEKNFEVVDRTGKLVPHWNLEQLEHSGLIVREKPGPKNSLGLIKFMFPNKYNIYLHSTPAVHLFDRTKRDFSHGCIRVEDPEKLADWVLRKQPEWTPEQIHEAMEDGEDNHIVLVKPAIPVVVFYATAYVFNQGPEEGQVHFLDDIYGYDKDMEEVLAQGMPYPVKPEPKQQAADTE